MRSSVRVGGSEIMTRLTLFSFFWQEVEHEELTVDERILGKYVALRGLVAQHARRCGVSYS